MLFLQIKNWTDNTTFELQFPQGQDIQIHDLRLQIQAETGISPEEQKLVLYGKLITNNSAFLGADLLSELREQFLLFSSYKNKVKIDLMQKKPILSNIDSITYFATYSYYQLPIELRAEISAVTPPLLAMDTPTYWASQTKQEKCDLLKQLDKPVQPARFHDYSYFPLCELPAELEKVISRIMTEQQQVSSTPNTADWDNLSEDSKKALLSVIEWDIIEIRPNFRLLMPANSFKGITNTHHASPSTSTFFQAVAPSANPSANYSEFKPFF